MKLTTVPLPAFRYPLRDSSPAAPRRLALVLLAAAVLICAAIWVAAIQIAQGQRNNLLAASIRENHNRAIAYHHFIAGMLDRADSAAVQLTREHRGMAPAPSGSPVLPLSDSAAIDPLFARIEVIDVDGHVRWASRPGETDEAASGDAFRLLRTSGTNEPLLTPSHARVATGQPAIVFARAIRRADGSFGGIVALHIPIDRLTRFYEGANFRAHDLISVVRLDGLTLARREGAILSFGQNLAGKLAMQRQAIEPWGTYIGPSSVDGVRRIFSQRRLARYGLFVSVGLGIDDALAPSYARTRIFYLTVAALTVALLGGTLAFWLGLRRREAIIGRLAATNQRLSEAQAIGKMGDWELDLKTNLLACSDQACRMHGRDPEHDVVTAEEALAFYDPDGRADIERALLTAVASKQPAQCDVVSTKGSRVTHLRVRMSPVVDPDGRVRTVLGTEQDITTEWRHEQLRAEVAHITRVEAVNVMAATIAHELSQPLTAAGNYLSAATYLAEQGKHSLVEQERMAVLLSQASRQIGLSGKIIARARDMVSDRRTGEVASLDDIVEEAIALSKVAEPAVARVAISARLEPDTGHVAADKVQIQQVLLNLIRNAAQAVAGSEKPQILVTSRREEAGMVTVSVADNGKGLPSHVDDIFAPFGAAGRNGLGIGLSICRTIVDSYGGRIWSGASPLGGAAICFTLPLDEIALLYDVA